MHALRLALVPVVLLAACATRPVGAQPMAPAAVLAQPVQPAPVTRPAAPARPQAAPDPLPAALAAVRGRLDAALGPDVVAEAHALPAQPLIAIRARLDPAHDRLAGTQDLWWPNTLAVPLTTIALRCPANAPAFNRAGLTIGEATWNGIRLNAPVVTDDGTGFTWTLPTPLPPGASGLLRTAFTATCSTGGGFHGLMSRDGDRWTLYHWHPELAAQLDGAWSLPPVTGTGDESQLAAADITAELTVPAGLSVIAGGSEAAPVPAGDGWTTVAISAPLARNLAVVLAGDLRPQTTQVGAIRVRSWAIDAHRQSGARALATATASLGLFDRSFGRYPYRELDVVESAQGDGVGGMESSGLVLIAASAYDACELQPAGDGPANLAVLMLEMPVAHEVAHQWWYGIVGSDAFHDPWLDEALTNWTGGWALERAYGAPGRQASLNMCLMETLMGANRRPARMDQALDGFASMDAYGMAVYARGTLMYEDLRERLGDRRFLAWLRSWAERHRFGVATPADWHRALAEVLGQAGAEAFAARWIRADGLTPAALRGPVTRQPAP